MAAETLWQDWRSSGDKQQGGRFAGDWHLAAIIDLASSARNGREITWPCRSPTATAVAESEFLLVHPGGPFLVRRRTPARLVRSQGPVEADVGQLAAARREFAEGWGSRSAGSRTAQPA